MACPFKRIILSNIPYIKSDGTTTYREINLIVPNYLQFEDVCDSLEIVYMRIKEVTRSGVLRQPFTTEEDIDSVSKLLQFSTQIYINRQAMWVQSVLESST